MSIALITPTGGRLRQLRFCAEYMRTQTYKGTVEWVIVDDCTPFTSDFIENNFREGWNITKLYPKPAWRPNKNTQCRNLLEGIRYIETLKGVDSVFIIEDDDYYASRYIEKMMEYLKLNDLVGECCTPYYHIGMKKILINQNRSHSSLFQTAFNISLLSLFEDVVKSNRTYIDVLLWKRYKGLLFLSKPNLSVGIKGLPGRPGIGVGHTNFHYPGKVLNIIQIIELFGENYINYV